MKQCTKCKQTKQLTDFCKDKKTKDGLHGHCKSCRYIASKKWIEENKEKYCSSMKKHQDRKRKWYQEYKKTLKCQQCGESHVACLVFHHRNPDEKEFCIGHSFVGKPEKQIKEEITKCDVLCANCHRKLHYNEKLSKV